MVCGGVTRYPVVLLVFRRMVVWTHANPLLVSEPLHSVAQADGELAREGCNRPRSCRSENPGRRASRSDIFCGTPLEIVREWPLEPLPRPPCDRPVWRGMKNHSIRSQKRDPHRGGFPFGRLQFSRNKTISPILTNISPAIITRPEGSRRGSGSPAVLQKKAPMHLP